MEGLSPALWASLLAVLSKGAEAAAVLEAVAIVALWRAWRNEVAGRVADNQKTIDMLRSETERAKQADNRVMTNMAQVLSILHGQLQQPPPVITHQPRSHRRRVDHVDDE